MDFKEMVLCVFALLSLGMLGLAGLHLFIEGQLPAMQLALGGSGGLLVLTVGRLSK